MSYEKVISEIKNMIEVYDIGILLIEDDHFLSNKERAKKILKTISKYNIRLEFPNGIAVYAIDEELGKLLNQSGATVIPLAIESGSDYILEHVIDKPLRVRMIKKAVEILRNNEIKVHAFIVVGLPGELEEHRKETINMIISIGFDWVYFFLAIPIAGSRLYKICEENGFLINNDFSNYNTTKCNIRTPEIDPEYMEKQIYLMNLDINFIRNNNMKNWNYRRAYSYFASIVNSYPEHAFAHYCLAKIYEEEKFSLEQAEFHKNIFYKIINSNTQWMEYARIFNLEI